MSNLMNLMFFQSSNRLVWKEAENMSPLPFTMFNLTVLTPCFENESCQVSSSYCTHDNKIILFFKDMDECDDMDIDALLNSHLAFGGRWRQIVSTSTLL